MNALTLPAPRRRNQVVILSALNLAPKSPTALRRALSALRSIRVTAPGLNLCAASAATLAAFFGSLAECEPAVIVGSAVATACIFFVDPLLSRSKARKGGEA